jgi:hypothetical protein
MIEAEHIGLHHPCAGRHAVKAESAIIVGQSHQAPLALGGANGDAGDRLIAGFDGSRFGGRRSGRLRNRLAKNKWQAHCQKHENFEH